MLESLYIKNYRLFKELKINSLKRINLIIGKNNVGKSSLLETFYIYCCNGLIQPFIPCSRQEILSYDNLDFRDVYKSCLSLFSDQNEIYIGQNEQDGISFCFNDNKCNINKNSGENKIIEFADLKTIIQASKWLKHLLPAGLNLRLNLPGSGTNTFNLSEDWSKIALSPKENYVIEGLKIIDKKIERIAFVKDQKAIVKLKNNDEPVDLKNMGDGITHILKTILSLVNCEDGYFLIDEFETGLHWSVQVELWKIIFHLAYKLNIQIFATTHSRDTLWALQQVALSKGYENDTRVIKLKHLSKKQTIKAIEINIDEIKEVIEQGLEIR